MGQKSYIKDTTDFINFVEETFWYPWMSKACTRTSHKMMEFKQYGVHMRISTIITLLYHLTILKKMLVLILKENSFEFKGENYLQTHGTAMGTKMAVAFANIFMAEIETNLLNQSRIKPIAWKRYIDDVFSLCDTKREDLDIFITQANKYHPTIKFAAETSDAEIAFLDTVVYEGVRFETGSILNIKTHSKPT